MIDLTDLVPAFMHPDEQPPCGDVDPEWFFPGDVYVDIRIPLSICNRCHMQPECLEYALEAFPRVTGIWGGTTDNDRARIRQQRRRINLRKAS